MERLTRTHVAVPISLFVIYATALLLWSIIIIRLDWYIVIGLYFSGLLLFTWVEYQVHKNIFHLRPTTAYKKKFQYTIHGVHHAFPKDKRRLAMPPVLSITIATALLVVLKLFIGDCAFAFLPGFLTGYAGYLLVHYVIHVFPPPSTKMRVLWVHHSVHHYKSADKAFGVSSPIWDYVYRTMP